MAKARRQRIVFAEYEGKLYVLAQAVMNSLIPLIDGLPITFFGKSKKMYLDVDTAINWCREEMKYHSADKYKTMIEVMERAKSQTEALVEEEE